MTGARRKGLDTVCALRLAPYTLGSGLSNRFNRPNLASRRSRCRSERGRVREIWGVRRRCPIRQAGDYRVGVKETVARGGSQRARGGSGAVFRPTGVTAAIACRG